MWTPAQLPAVFGREAEGAGGAGGGGRHVLRGSRNLATLYQRRHLRLGEAAPCVSTTPADVHALFFLDDVVRSTQSRNLDGAFLLRMSATQEGVYTISLQVRTSSTLCMHAWPVPTASAQRTRRA